MLPTREDDYGRLLRLIDTDPTNGRNPYCVTRVLQGEYGAVRRYDHLDHAASDRSALTQEAHMNDRAIRQPGVLLSTGLLVMGLLAFPAWAADVPRLHAPITVVMPGQALIPHIDSLILLLPGEAARLDTRAREHEHGLAHAEREVSEIESAVKEAAEESQELQEEARDIDND